MIAADCGSVLVMRDSHPGDLVGIFTERDVLRRIPEIRQRNAWEKSVALVMTQKVRTITTADIPDAAEIMLEGRFRHLPVVETLKAGPSAGKTQILGVISIRDVLRNTVAPVSSPIQAVLCTLLPGFARSLIRVSTDVLEIGLKSIPLEKIYSEKDGLSTKLDAFSVAVIDIDHRKDALWLQFLKACNHERPKLPVILTYDPDIHPETTLRSLKKIGLAKNFHLFPKPVNLLALAGQIVAPVKP